MQPRLFSYVVRYDSGFAPNPFFGYCTLATCKPKIRHSARVGDWLLGTGSNAKRIRRGGYLVYAMRVTEIVSTQQYWSDSRFQRKKPDLYYNWIAASGDNIYEHLASGGWRQLNSYHSKNDGTCDDRHVARDTSVEKVLVSDDFVYFGGEGPRLPAGLCEGGKTNLVHKHQNYRVVREEENIVEFERWIDSLGVKGFQGKPWDWLERRK